MSTGNSLNSLNLLRRWNTPQSEWSLGAKVSHPIPQGLTIQSPKVFHWNHKTPDILELESGNDHQMGRGNIYTNDSFSLKRRFSPENGWFGSDDSFPFGATSAYFQVRTC